MAPAGRAQHFRYFSPQITSTSFQGIAEGPSSQSFESEEKFHPAASTVNHMEKDTENSPPVTPQIVHSRCGTLVNEQIKKAFVAPKVRGENPCMACSGTAQHLRHFSPQDFVLIQLEASLVLRPCMTDFGPLREDITIQGILTRF